MARIQIFSAFDNKVQGIEVADGARLGDALKLFVPPGNAATVGADNDNRFEVLAPTPSDSPAVQNFVIRENLRVSIWPQKLVGALGQRGA